MCICVIYFSSIFTDGNRYELILEVYAIGGTVGVDTPVSTRTIEVRTETPSIAPTLERMYWASQLTNVAADFVTVAENSQTGLTGDITFPTFSAPPNRFFAIAYPNTADALTAIRFLGVNTLSDWTVTASAITVGGVAYTVAILNRGQQSALTATLER